MSARQVARDGLSRIGRRAGRPRMAGQISAWAACLAIAVVTVSSAFALPAEAADAKDTRRLEGCSVEGRPVTYRPNEKLRVIQSRRVAGYVVEIVEFLTVESRRVKEKSIRRYVKRNDEQILRFRRNGVYLDCFFGEKLRIYPPTEPSDDEWSEDGIRSRLGANVTGGGAPNLVILDAGFRTYTMHVFDLGRIPVKLATIEGYDSDISLIQLDDDPALEATLRDTQYTNWRSFAGDSAYPMVILKFEPEGRRYRFAAELMRQPPPSPAYLESLARELREDPVWHDPWYDQKSKQALRFPPMLPQAMLDLIYSGNFPAARLLLELAWNPASKGREDFYVDLVECRLRDGRFWPDVAALNNLPAKDPDDRSCPIDYLSD